MITKSIFFKNFRLKTNNKSIKKDLKLLIKKNDDILHSLSTKYKNSYSKKTILSLKKYFHIKIIGMGGSILGAEAIYDFLKHKVKKNFYFINNLKSKNNLNNKKNKSLSIIISKSGNTLETISNTNIYLKNKEKSIFITENKTSYLSNIAKKLTKKLTNSI